jgi:putative membrane protein
VSETVIRAPGTTEAGAGHRRRWSPARLAGAIVLASWATLFWFLLLSGRDAFYLSTRTEWVVPVAALLLTASAAGRIASARVTATQPLRRHDLAVAAAMVVPVLLVLVLPPATLGTFSAGKRAGVTGVGPATSGIGGELTLVDVAAAQTTPEGERALARHAGETVTFVGLVARYGDTPADELLLTRYVVSCCVADATVAQVRVVNVTPGTFEDDEWVQVTGTIFPIGRQVIVNATAGGIVEVARPERPYLSF